MQQGSFFLDFAGLLQQLGLALDKGFFFLFDGVAGLLDFFLGFEEVGALTLEDLLVALLARSDFDELLD